MTEETKAKILEELEEATKDFVTQTKEPCGKWFLHFNGDRVEWRCLGITTGKQVREIARISLKYQRDIHINTGGK